MAALRLPGLSRRCRKQERSMLADVLYFVGGLAAFALIAASVAATGRL